MIMNAKYNINFLNWIHKIYKDVLSGSCIFVCVEQAYQEILLLSFYHRMAWVGRDVKPPSSNVATMGRDVIP